MNRPGEKWNTQQIANFFGHSRRHTTNYTVKQPDFPKPIIALSQKTKFWLRVDVERYAMKK